LNDDNKNLYDDDTEEVLYIGVANGLNIVEKKSEENCSYINLNEKDEKAENISFSNSVIQTPYFRIEEYEKEKKEIINKTFSNENKIEILKNNNNKLEDNYKKKNIFAVIHSKDNLIRSNKRERDRENKLDVLIDPKDNFNFDSLGINNGMNAINALNGLDTSDRIEMNDFLDNYNPLLEPIHLVYDSDTFSEKNFLFNTINNSLGFNK
jgi:hypothetical protein